MKTLMLLCLVWPLKFIADLTQAFGNLVRLLSFSQHLTVTVWEKQQHLQAKLKNPLPFVVLGLLVALSCLHMFLG